MTEPLQPMTDADIAAARKLAGAIAAWTYDEDCNEPPVCCDCGGEYHMDDWSDEATPLCHGCAQRRITLVPRLLAEVERLRAEQLRADCDALTMPAALDEVERLTRERDEARAEWAKQENLKTVYRDGVQQATREIDRLRDENAELRATASLFAERIDTEIAASRARWLTAEERETLRAIRAAVNVHRIVPADGALVVLDKLLKEMP